MKRYQRPPAGGRRSAMRSPAHSKLQPKFMLVSAGNFVPSMPKSQKAFSSSSSSFPLSLPALGSAFNVSPYSPLFVISPDPSFFRACVRKVDESRARARKKPSFSLLFNSSRGGKNHQLFWVKGRMRSSTVDSHSS